jgi:hypothetical protein
MGDDDVNAPREVEAEDRASERRAALRHAAIELRRLERRLAWQRCVTPLARLRFVRNRVLQPLSAILRAAVGTRRYGHGVSSTAGVPRLTQFVQQCVIGTRLGYDSDTYYRFRLYRLEDLRDAVLFMPMRANRALRPQVYERLGLDPTQLSNKAVFYRTAQLAGLPVPRALAEFRNGTIDWWPNEREGELPELDLFSKESDNLGGKGAARWIWLRAGLYQAEGNRELDARVLIDRLRQISLSAPQLLQVRVRNHPQIEPLSPGTLCTIRVVTYRFPDGEPRHLASTFRLASRPIAADNFSQGGLAAAVNPQTGTLRPAVFKDLTLTAAEHANHPVTGAKIAGFPLPHWPEVLELALHAHSVFPAYPSIGWDIAISRSGPVLIEGNYNWNVALVQQASSRGLGETDYLESYLAFLRQAPP